MVRTIAISTAAVALTAGLTAAPAAAAPVDAGAACVQAGIGTLRDLDLLRAAALRDLDYSTLADPVNGPIFTDLPEGSSLSLGQVVRLHRTSPTLFAWCR